MNAPSSASLSPDAAAILAVLKPEQAALSAKTQADLWIKMGIGAFSIVMVGGFALVMNGISQAGSLAHVNSEKIDQLTENVTMLVVASQNMQGELTKRSGWMDGQDLYSEESRLKDQEHDQRIKALETRALRQ